MKLVMTLLVRDEEDIIKANIDFHRTQGVDFFIVTDNKSIDSTPDILKEYENSGLLCYIREDGAYNQSKLVSSMAELAYKEYQADWVINNDADEFWFSSANTLKEYFRTIKSHYAAVRAKRHTFVPLDKVDYPFYDFMIYRQKNSVNPVGGTLHPKIAHRGLSEVVVKAGNNAIVGVSNDKVFDSNIDILHFSVRDYEQLVRKTVHIASEHISAGTNKGRTGMARISLYQQYVDNGYCLQKYFAQHVYDKERIERELESGQVIIDDRLKRYMRSKLPRL